MPVLTKEIGFSASHYYWLEALSEAQNWETFHACANRHGHGHNYRVNVSIVGDIHPETGMIINFFDLDPLLQRCIVEPLDHKNLNAQVPYFQNRIPTLENIARFVWDALYPEIRQLGHDLVGITVIENSDLYVENSDEMTYQLTLTRKYTFSAAHRLWNPDWSAEENQRCFGKCVHLHGHNYALEVTIEGIPSEATGMIMDITLLDALVQDYILEKVDHRHLDEDVAFVSGTLSTVENLARLIYEQLARVIPAPVQLHRIRLFENETNWTEYSRKGDYGRR